MTPENKATAQQLLAEGNEKFVVNQFREALESYKAALAVWDHPAIRFNMVRTLLALEKYVEAQENLEKALEYGPAPFEDTLYREALNYQRLLANQIATLDIKCNQPAVDVKVDGSAFVSCPGRVAKQILPGKHALVAAKPGFRTDTKDLVLFPGKKEPIEIELITIEKATGYRTRWAAWKPWAVAAGGLALVGIGYWINHEAQAAMDDLAARLEQCGPDGCGTVIDPVTQKPVNEYEARGFADDEASALLRNKIAIGFMATGGAVVIGGLVGVIINRPKPYLKTTREAQAPTAQLVPIVHGNHGGFAITGRF